MPSRPFEGLRVNGNQPELTLEKSSNKLTHQLLISRHPVFQERAGKHQVVHLFRRTRQHSFERNLGVVFALLPACALRGLVRNHGSSFFGTGAILDVGRRCVGRRTLGRLFVDARRAGVRLSPDVDEDVVCRVSRNERGKGVILS